MPYPNMGERIPYELDGSAVFVNRNSGADQSIKELPANAVAALNSDRGAALYIEGESIYPASDDAWNVRYSGQLASRYPIPGGLLETGPHWVAVIFPKPMRLRGAHFSQYMSRSRWFGGSGTTVLGQFPMTILISDDTTNGQDGTWTEVLTAVGPGWSTENPPNDAPPVTIDGETLATSQGNTRTARYFRRDASVEGRGIFPFTGRQIKGVRLALIYNPDISQQANGDWTGDSFSYWEIGDTLNAVLFNLHLYGEPDTDATDNRLEFVTPAGDPMDFTQGDVWAGKVIVQQFKLRNLSPTDDATTVELSLLAPLPAPTPSPHVSMEFSLNGVTYSSTLSIGSIPAGTDSATIYLRTTVPAGIMGAMGPRLLAEVGEWV